MTGGPATPPRRERITRSGSRRRAALRAPLTEIDEQTEVGAVYMRSLLRAQLRLAVVTLAVVLGTLAVLPVLFLLVPQVAAARLLGMPLPWLVLGALVYPLLVGVGGFYVRQAERTERDFADLLRPR